MVTVIVLGVVLIAVSVPFLRDAGAGGTEYVISWDEAESGTTSSATGAAGAPATIELPVSGILASNATVELTSCNDAGTPPINQPATISWTLFFGSAQVEDGTASCANQGPFRVALDGHPDVGSATASSPDAAVEEAEGAGEAKTGTYRLEFSWSRPAAPGGLPLPQPAFAATVELTIEEWTAAANVPGQEGPR